jgi:DNA (cytosine-5)-methyltransferase 1
MSKSGPTVVSLFAGLGGLDLGFHLAGFQVVWANELAENAVRSYEVNFGLRPRRGDITQIPDDEIPDADVIIGGPPCQSFSLVGQRRSDDDRGRLVFRFRDIVLAKMPQAFVMENVPGMAASRIEGTRLPRVLANEFEDAGYHVTVTKLLATDFLVPQLRSRIFILGARPRPVENPDPDVFANECYGANRAEFDISAAAAIGDLGVAVSKGELSSYRSVPHSTLSRILRQGNGDTVSLHEMPRMSDLDMEFVKHIPPGGNYRDIPDKISTERIMKFKASGGRTTTYGRLHPDRPSYTINTYFRRPNVGFNFHYSESRLISPREAMRFQCFPDRFQVHYGAQDERNAYIGNAVPSLLGQAVAWTIRNCLEGRSIQETVKQGIFSFKNGK